MKYKLFGRSGLRVSELCLGTMTFGMEWGWGATRQESQKIFDTFVDAGGNFIDTANRYTEGTSERYLSDMIYSERSNLVLATKYSLHDRLNDPNSGGNHRKNMMQSVEDSLYRLDTEYIDLLWLHAWDFTTHLDEIMRGLNDLVSSGKVMYIGISDTPAWIVASANTMADLRGWAAFCGLQIEYSLIERTPERELLPMAKYNDIAVTPWAPLAGGALTGKYLKSDEEPKRLKEGSKRLNDRNTAIAQEVVNIAAELEVSPAQVAINWTRQKDQVMIPIVGARKVSQIEDSLGCIEFELDPEQISRLDEVSKIDMGFPHEFLSSDPVKNIIFGGMQDKIENHRRY